MYVEIKENKLLSWCEKPYSDYVYVDIDYSTFEPNRYKVVNNTLESRENDEDYIAEQEAKAKAEKNAQIQKQLDEIDKKRIRALAEGGDKEQGKSWLQHYNEQAIALRAELEE